MQNMKIKIHQAYRTIVAVVDSDLVGKVFEEGIMRIDVRQNFFGGDEKNKEEIIEILKDMKKEDATFNIVGKEACESALKAGVISEEGIIHIGGVPIALVLL
jgi:hypothetical protein